VKKASEVYLPTENQSSLMSLQPSLLRSDLFFWQGPKKEQAGKRRLLVPSLSVR